MLLVWEQLKRERSLRGRGRRKPDATCLLGHLTNNSKTIAVLVTLFVDQFKKKPLYLEQISNLS